MFENQFRAEIIQRVLIKLKTDIEEAKERDPTWDYYNRHITDNLSVTFDLNFEHPSLFSKYCPSDFCMEMFEELTRCYLSFNYEGNDRFKIERILNSTTHLPITESWCLRKDDFTLYLIELFETQSIVFNNRRSFHLENLIEHKVNTICDDIFGV